MTRSTLTRCFPVCVGSLGRSMNSLFFKHMVSVSQKAKRSPQISATSKQPQQLSSSEITDTSIARSTCQELDAQL